jgi:hypothetical protein
MASLRVPRGELLLRGIGAIRCLIKRIDRCDRKHRDAAILSTLSLT